MKTKPPTMFSYVSLEQRVPSDHPLRAIRKMADQALAELSAQFEELYARRGRPSIPPEQLLRALLLQVLHGIPRASPRATLGADKRYQEAQFIEGLRQRRIAPHGAEYNCSAHWGNSLTEAERNDPGFAVSQKKRKLVERVFGWGKLDMCSVSRKCIYSRQALKLCPDAKLTHYGIAIRTRPQSFGSTSKCPGDNP